MPIGNNTIQNDTIPEVAFEAALDTDSVVVKHEVLTPAKVLSWLPADATPEQQDSMIQAYFHPGPIHWSERPDTLRLPGDEAPTIKDFITERQFLKESFFAKDSLYNPEVKVAGHGVSGDPVPYTIANDNFITSLLLGCFLLAVLAISKSRQFIARQAKNFFRVANEKTTVITETSSELRSQLFLVMQTCLLLAIIYFFYQQGGYTQKTYLVEQNQLIGIFSLVIAAYFIIKALLYLFVDWVFFTPKQNEMWLKSYLFLVSVEGVLLFPMVMLQSYFQMSIHTTNIYTIVVLIVIKMLTLYRCYTIFFKRNGGFLQNILYFCALEITTLILLLTAIKQISDYLTINF